jgi:LysM repeat protein
MSDSPPGTHPTDGQKPGPSPWRSILTGLVAVGGVALTLIAALVLSSQDLPIPTQPPLPTPIRLGPTPATLVPLPSPTSTPQIVPATIVPTSPLPTVEPTATTLVEATVEPPTATPVIIASPTQVCIPPAGWVPYAVQPGDTLNSLTKRYRVDSSQLLQANCLLNQTLFIGQVLYVPPVTAAPTRPPCRPPLNWIKYIVQPGDTLFSLAARTQTTVNALVQANCLGSNARIYAGQELWLPYLPPPPTFTPPMPPPATNTPTATTPAPDTPTPTSSSQPPTATQTPSPTAAPTLPSPTPTGTDTPPPTNTPVPFLTPTQTSS